MATLPIDIVPDRNPMVFRWRFRAEGVGGGAVQHCEGNLPPSVEGAVALLIALTKQLQLENGVLREKLEKVQAPQQAGPPPQQQQKKGK